MKGRLQRIFATLGPGFITGASDDDPAGIATYSQIGAMFGYGMAWTLLFAFPLMSAVQYVSGVVGGATGKGLAGNLREHYPRWIIYVLAALLFIANVINVGADIGAMAAATTLLLPGPRFAYAAGYGVLTVLLISFLDYESYARYLKWLSLTLLAYVASAVAAGTDWGEALRSLFLPSVRWSGAFLGMLVAVLGTTISPYLVFWESSHEVEKVKDEGEGALKDEPAPGRREMRRLRADTLIGMGVSNVIGAFIVFTCAATLHAHGKTDIQSAQQAAEALRPFAGAATEWIFAAGIVGTGLLAVPVLAGSAAFSLGEGLGFRVGLDLTPARATAFYGVIALVTAIGVALNLLHVNVITFLVATAIINGVVELPVLLMMMLVARNRRIMGDFAISRTAATLGWLTLVVMTAAAAGMFATL